MYMWEQHGMSAAAALTGIMMGSGMPKQDYAPTLKQKVFARFFEHIGMGDHAAIINVIVTKVGWLVGLVDAPVWRMCFDSDLNEYQVLLSEAFSRKSKKNNASGLGRFLA